MKILNVTTEHYKEYIALKLTTELGMVSVANVKTLKCMDGVYEVEFGDFRSFEYGKLILEKCFKNPLATLVPNTVVLRDEDEEEAEPEKVEVPETAEEPAPENEDTTVQRPKSKPKKKQ